MPMTSKLKRGLQSPRIWIAFVLIASIFVLSRCQTETKTQEATNAVVQLPGDPYPACVVTPSVFAGWFQSGSVTLNGVATPANSIAFPHNDNCDFYQWAEHMFLWLTSPTPAQYGGGNGRVFTSQIFYDVSPPDAAGNRSFISQRPDVPILMGVRAAQAGPDGLPVVLTAAGKLVEVIPGVLPGNKQFQGLRIGKDKPLIPAKLKGKAIVAKFKVQGRTVFLAPDGTVVPVETGQADGGVLLAQNGSLIYYTIDVNDVYAYFRTGGAHSLNTTLFPTTQSGFDSIAAFGAKRGMIFTDSVALTLEVKSSWVLASTIPDSQSYITIKAVVPTYDRSNSKVWTVKGQDTVTLALVGMHVVGSAAGHPEMIWATFEHLNLTPDSTYDYINANQQQVQVGPNTGGSWVFSQPNYTGTYNQMLNSYDPPNIVADSPNTKIQPSNDIRMKPWGAGFDKMPNQLDTSVAESNTEIISINNSVRNQLIAGDIRANYLLRGATWTIGGAIPTGPYPNGGNEVGTSLLCNSTMETFQQGANRSILTGANCFDCHQSGSSAAPLADTGVSHIFSVLKPLF